MKTLLSIVGPTASGKTSVAVKLALHFKTAVISADSRQIYKGLNIGTAKPTSGEMQGIPHYFTDLLNPDETINSGKYGDKVREILPGLFNEHEVVIMAGGSGFYFSAVWEGLNEIPNVPAEIREAVNRDLAEKGLPFLLEELQNNDPVLFDKIDRNNPRRVTRGVEVFRASGIPLSHFHKGPGEMNKNYRDLKIGLLPEKGELREAIHRRVDEMIAAGLVDEVKTLIEKYGNALQAFHTVGYAEIIRHLRGEIGLEEAIELIKTNTRQYARRQMTWFRRYDDIHWFHPREYASIEKLASDAAGV